jgi:hypothetical protein
MIGLDQTAASVAHECVHAMGMLQHPECDLVVIQQDDESHLMSAPLNSRQIDVQPAVVEDDLHCAQAAGAGLGVLMSNARFTTNGEIVLGLLRSLPAELTLVSDGDMQAIEKNLKDDPELIHNALATGFQLGFLMAKIDGFQQWADTVADLIAAGENIFLPESFNAAVRDADLPDPVTLTQPPTPPLLELLHERDTGRTDDG